jgi:hypothetical protein
MIVFTFAQGCVRALALDFPVAMFSHLYQKITKAYMKHPY